MSETSAVPQHGRQPEAPSGQRHDSTARIVLAGAVAAVLWLASGGVLQALRWFTDYAPAAGIVLPETMPGTVWVWPLPWSIAAVLLGAAAVGAAAVALLLLLRARGALGRLSAWLVVVAVGAWAGALIDVAFVIDWLQRTGLRQALSFRGPAASAAVGAYWGLIQGWIVALIVARRAPRRTRTAVLAVPLAVALVLGLAYGGAAVAGSRAASQVAAQEAAEAEGLVSEEDGVSVDPGAQGDPVPEAASPEGTRDSARCEADELTLMLGNPDAATGHRVLPLRVVNISEEPCDIGGYPDVAFEDQNGHLLDATVEQGSSFMAQDPGPQTVTLAPGAFAISFIGWNANSTHGALVATAVHAAAVPGDPRVSWPSRPVLDIVEGSEVFVTAWAPDEASQPE
ncbi:MAG: DUF4232 domain-containing protein [Leucobacter sp.]